MLATHHYEFKVMTYMAYMTESIRLQGENKVLRDSWIDIVKPSHQNTRSAEEIISDVIEKGGLVVRE